MGGEKLQIVSQDHSFSMKERENGDSKYTGNSGTHESANQQLLLGNYCVPGIILNTSETAVNKI